MSSFKKTPRDNKAIEQFAGKASMQSNPDKIKKQLDGFYTRLRPEVKEIIKALSWHHNISQREVIEEGITRLIEADPERVKKAMKRYQDYRREEYEIPDIDSGLDLIS